METKDKKLQTGLRTVLLVLVIVNVVIVVLLAILSPTFLSYANISAVLRRMSELNMLAIAETFVFISGGFDLSIGAIMAVSGMIVGQLYAGGLPFIVGLIAGIAAGAVAGAVNGLLIVKLRLQPFVVTLATMTIMRSVVYGVLRGNTISDLPAWYLRIGEIYIIKLPLLFLFMIIVAVVAALILRKTKMGRNIFAIGGNENASFISGVRVKRVKYFVYIFSGVVCALAGIMHTIRIRAAYPDAGLNVPLQVVTAVLIGGTLITGGKGSIIGTTLGVLAMFLLTNGFSLLGLVRYWEQVALGVILIYVVGREGINAMIMQLFHKRKKIPRSG